MNILIALGLIIIAMAEGIWVAVGTFILFLIVSALFSE